MKNDKIKPVTKEDQAKMRQRSRRKIMIETPYPKCGYHASHDKYISNSSALSEEFLLLEEELDMGDCDD